MQPIAARIAPVLDRAPGGAVVVARKFAAALTTSHEEAFELELGSTPFGADELITDDARFDGGVVRIGTSVTTNDVLVAMRAFGPRGARDASLRVPPGVSGTVLETAQHEGRVRVLIGWDRPLAVGDVIADEHGRRGTVVEIADG